MPRESLAAFVDDIYPPSDAINVIKGKIDRIDLRQALEMAIPAIDKLQDSLLPSPKFYTPTTKLMHELEASIQGPMTKQDLMLGLLEQATSNDKEVDVDEINKLADNVMDKKTEMLRDEVRNNMDKFSVDLANLILNLPDDNIIVCETMKALEPSLSGKIDKTELTQNLDMVAERYGIYPASKLS